MILSNDLIKSHIRGWKTAYKNFVDDKIEDKNLQDINLNEMFVLWVIYLFTKQDANNPPKMSDIVSTVQYIAVEIPGAPLFNTKEEIYECVDNLVAFGFIENL